jgi:hypothetical protein
MDQALLSKAEGAKSQTILYIERYDFGDKNEVITKINFIYNCFMDDKPISRDQIIVHGQDNNRCSNFILSLVSAYVETSKTNENKISTNNIPIFFESLLNREWTKDYQYYNSTGRLIAFFFSKIGTEDVDLFYSKLKAKNYDEFELVKLVIENDYSPLYINSNFEEPSNFNLFIKKAIDKQSSLIRKLNSFAFNGPNTHYYFRRQYLVFLMNHFPEELEENLEQFLITKKDYNNILYDSIEMLIRKDAFLYGQRIIDLLNSRNDRIAMYDYHIYALLEDRGFDVDKQQMQSFIDYFLNDYCNNSIDERGYNSNNPHLKDNTIISFHFETLYKKDKENAYNEMLSFCQKAVLIPYSIIKTADQLFHEKSISILVNAFSKKNKNYKDSFVSDLTAVLDKYGYEAYIEEALVFAQSILNKQDRSLFCKSISKQGSNVASKAESLLKGKVIAERIIGALILSNFEDSSIKAKLNEAIDSEKNDETRNVMLDALKEERFGTPLTEQACKEMIGLADKRKKISTWSEKWLNEEELQPLYWKSGEKLDKNAIRFLIYRMKQVSGLNSDIEARQVIDQLDMEKTEKFSLQLMQSFMDSNADTKLKYYLTLSGLIGGNVILYKLDALFRKLILDKRVKVAEYVLGAMAMIGSDKALRMIDVISRKYASKKPKLSEVAIQALEAAALELNISKEQLSDRIIPNFGFDGLYREIEVGDETYRAFINMDFQLCYFDENNKLRKSLPKDASKELKLEIKEIEKELKDVIKSQTNRLENFLTIDRKWMVNDWEQFFLLHPIMFVYANKLLWVLCDSEDKLLNIFYCNEDAEMLDLSSEEIDLSIGSHVKIFHPLHTSAELLQKWKDKLYDLSLLTLLPQVDRTIFTKAESDLNLNATQLFSNRDIPKGADFVAGFLEKKGWTKYTGDGGGLHFTKTLREPFIQANPYIEGPAVWYQGGETKAKVHDITFNGKGNEKIKIQDIPAIWYSEVLGDFNGLINA